MIRFEEVTKVYGNGTENGGKVVRALDGITTEIAKGEFVAITGESGCGKSTMMHLIGGLDRPTTGTLSSGEVQLHAATEQIMTEYRRKKLGVVFQFFNLLPTMRVWENVAMPLLLQGMTQKEAAERAGEALEMVGMEPRKSHFPHQLSGGEMQRTAIARALVHRPELLLADEPTGNLDSRNARGVVGVLEKIASQGTVTMVIVTHSEEVARTASRRIHLRDGKITHESINRHRKPHSQPPAFSRV